MVFRIWPETYGSGLMTGSNGTIACIVLKRMNVFPARKEAPVIIARRKDLPPVILKFCVGAHGMKSLENTQ